MAVVFPGALPRPPCLALCLPGAKLAGTGPLPLSGTLFLLAALGSVSFDGFSKTFFWLGANGINPLDYPGRTAMTGINGFGLLAASVLLTAAYLVSVAAGEALARGRQRGLAAAAGLLVWSIVPIALAARLASGPAEMVFTRRPQRRPASNASVRVSFSNAALAELMPPP